MSRLRSVVLPLLLLACQAADAVEISHGPLLGVVTEHHAAIWLRTDAAAEVEIRLIPTGKSCRQTLSHETSAATDFTWVARFEGLLAQQEYTYRVLLNGRKKFEAALTTSGPMLAQRALKVVFGACFSFGARIKDGPSIFARMAERKPDVVIFTGDMPYARDGLPSSLREGHKKIRSIPGFTRLTAATPTYAVYDDHDFGPNDCDGTHPHADQALAVFKQWWANPSYGDARARGIFSRVRHGNLEIFLLDGRYPQRQDRKNPKMLGDVQNAWLREGLKTSTARYKLLVSGTPFSRDKKDCWAGPYHKAERDRLFQFIADNHIVGVLMISGDIHRTDIFKLKIAEDRYLYDFTSSTLAKGKYRTAETDDVHIYAHGEHNAYGELVFLPPGDERGAVIFRDISGRDGVLYEFVLHDEDLGIAD